MPHLLVGVQGRPLHDPGSWTWSDGHLRVRIDEPDEECLHLDEDRLSIVIGRARAEVHGLGDRQIAELNGPLIVLTYDRRSREITVIRDWAGFGHAYFWETGRGWWLSTDLRELRRAGATALSGPGVAHYFTYQYVPTPGTVLEGVEQLPPGHGLFHRPGGRVRVRRLTTLPLAGDTVTDDQTRPPAERITELLTASLAGRLNGPPVAMTLSGGMDTSTNAVLLRERLGLRPLAFTAGFAEPGYDETGFARIVADRFDLDLVPVPIRPEMIQQVTEVAAAFDAPNADQAAFAEHLLAAAAAQRGCRQIVTGEGGDETLGLPQAHLDDLVPEKLPHDPAELARHYLAKTELASAPLRAELFRLLEVDQDVAHAPLCAIYREHDLSPLDRVLLGQWRTWLIDGVYMKEDRIFRRFGVEPVLPFMDGALMRYVFALPPRVRQSGISNKRLLRSAMGERLPAAILNRSKHKFWLPTAQWMKGPALHFLTDVLGPNGQLAGLFGAALPERLIKDHVSGESDHSRVLWAMLLLELWLDSDRPVTHIEPA